MSREPDHEGGLQSFYYNAIKVKLQGADIRHFDGFLKDLRKQNKGAYLRFFANQNREKLLKLNDAIRNKMTNKRPDETLAVRLEPYVDPNNGKTKIRVISFLRKKDIS